MKRMDAGLVLCIVLAGLMVTWSGLTAPGLWWTDESRHSMHGAFFVDFLRDLPWRTPYDYVQRYFAQYPALAFNWYLPLFPMAMGLVMSVAGVSEFSAHATVIGVWLLGVVGWYFWMVRHFDRLTAVTASLALLSMPVVVLWSRSVMLEAPAVGMCALSALFFQRYLDHPRHSTAVSAGLVLLATLLVKQTTLFILPVLLVYALSFGQGRRALWRKEIWWGVAMVAVALSVIAAHALLFGPEAVMAGESQARPGSFPWWSLGRWSMFARSLYLGAGPIIAVLALLGMALALYRRDRHAWVLPLTWLAASYIWSTYLANVPGNNQRYAFYAMPAVAFFAAYGLWHFADRRVLRWAWAGTLLLAVGLHGASAVRTPHRYVSGYEAAARLVHGLPNSGAILFAGKHDGNFVFHLRQLDRDRQRVVLRGDKTLVSMSVHKYFGIRSNVSDAADIKTLLNGHGVRWIVVESRDLVGLKEFRLLHETLRGPGFRLVATVPVTTNVAEFTDVNVLVYENLALQLPDSGRVRINFPYLGKSYDFTFPDPATN
ncbi:MAG: glycosyltransferase family 39 protein [Burkholderiaceae bacterium]|nr:glycosyltransferase family 39 protein [Burkholderiaceae bacterium]